MGGGGGGGLLLPNAPALWVSDRGRIEEEQVHEEEHEGMEEEKEKGGTRRVVPACPRCHGERTLEFQIMPQLLNHLALHHADPHALDFGTLLIYTCAQSCPNINVTSSTTTNTDHGAVDDELEFAEEFCWRQDFSSDGMHKEQQRLRFGM